ncbi:hypothetical protein QR680_007916 [Steinernema hermaphroditum]|uniref:MADF domain-containing protein n=1 Tax=Steinernema hermaphroditum TaxID=289476 RepID=A0AA39IGV0_9BILA|nr:hypothetical protein QR680_007916 [Steinernema hermaphroditum]
MIPLHTEIIYLLIGIPSLIFYGIIIFSLLKRSGPGFAFYRIFTFICIMDWLCYIINTVTYRLAMCPEFSFLYVNFTPSMATKMLYFLLFFCAYCQLFGQSLISLNRFTAMACPAKHQKFWQTYYLRAIGIVTFFAVACSWQNLFSNAHFMRHQMEETDRFFFTFKFDEMNIFLIANPLQFNSMMFACVGILNSIFQLTLHSATIVLLVQQRRRLQHSVVEPLPKHELNLLVLSVAMFLIGLTAAAYQTGVTILLYTDSNSIVGYLDYYLLIADLVNLSPPYLLFLVSDTARTTFIGFLRRVVLVRGHRVGPTTYQRYTLVNSQSHMEETISNDVKSHIIALVKSRENLWKVKTRSYKIDNKKAEDYQEVADEVNKLHGLSITGDQVRGVFKNLRDTYSRRIRNAKKDMKTTGSGAEITKTSKAKAQKEEAFPFLQEMEFLNENANDLDTPRRILGGESQDLHVAVAQSPPENTISSTMDIESNELHPEHEEVGHQARKRRKQLTHVEGELAQAVDDYMVTENGL